MIQGLLLYEYKDIEISLENELLALILRWYGDRLVTRKLNIGSRWLLAILLGFVGHVFKIYLYNCVLFFW